MKYIDQIIANFDTIEESRKSLLSHLIKYIQEKKDMEAPCELILICTHNSRRSHFSQIWAQIATDYYGLDFVNTYSGGTEATAFNIRAVNALKSAGLSIDVDDPEKDNPTYTIHYGEGKQMQAFSKTFDHPSNPQEKFAAVMTCDHVDENCPVVAGAEARIPLYYIDPKITDDSLKETETYRQRCLQIATELFYVFSQV